MRVWIAVLVMLGSVAHPVITESIAHAATASSRTGDVTFLSNHMIELFTNGNRYLTEIEVNGASIATVERLGSITIPDPVTHQRVHDGAFRDGYHERILLNRWLQPGKNTVTVRFTPTALRGHTIDYYLTDDDGPFAPSSISAFAALVEGEVPGRLGMDEAEFDKTVGTEGKKVQVMWRKRQGFSKGDAMKAVAFSTTIDLSPARYSFKKVDLKSCKWNPSFADFSGTVTMDGKELHQVKFDETGTESNVASEFFLSPGAHRIEINVTAIGKEPKAVFAVRCDLGPLKAELKTNRELGDFFDELTVVLLKVPLTAIGKALASFDYVVK